MWVARLPALTGTSLSAPAAVASPAVWASDVALGASAATATAEILWDWLAGQEGLVAMIGMLHLGGHRLAQQVFYFPQIGSVLRTAERNGVAVRPRPGGAPDAVHVGLGLHGKIVVDHVSDVVHIQSSRRNIGGDQNPETALLEAGQRFGAHGLALVAVNGVAVNARCTQLFHHPVGGVLHLGENEGLVDLGIAQKGDQQGILVLFPHEEHLLGNTLHRGFVGRDGHQHRVADHGVGQLHHFRSYGGREKQGLALRRNLRQHPFDVGDEAHIEHPVHLVENEDLYLIQVDESLLHQVEQPTGSGHENIDPTVQGTDLAGLVDPAEDHGMAEEKKASISLNAFPDLRCEFAGGGENEGPGGSFPVPAGIAGKPLQERQGKGSGLSGAGLGAAHQVTSFYQVRNALLLDRRGDDVSLRGHGSLKLRNQ